MRTPYILTFLLMAVVQLSIFCQNLVPNASFENCHQIPTMWVLNDKIFESSIKNWNSPNQGSPDIFFNKALARIRPRPKIELTSYQARTGSMMIGLALYGCDDALHCKEYIQVELTEPMKKGHRYAVEYWVNPLIASIKVNGLGVAFSENEIDAPKALNLYYIFPDFETNTIIDDTDPKSWVKISDTICAERNYAFMTIGTFRQDSEMDIVQEPNGLNYAYYLVDDVKVEQINSHCDHNPSIEEVINFRNIQFELNSARLSSSSFNELNKLHSYLSDNPTVNIKIIGHTDNTGNSEDNRILSENRAIAVLDYLTQKGIKKHRLQAEGHGELEPIAENSTEKGRLLNRRVEIVVAKD